MLETLTKIIWKERDVYGVKQNLT